MQSILDTFAHLILIPVEVSTLNEVVEAVFSPELSSEPLRLLLISHIILEAPQTSWVQDLPHHPTQVQRYFQWFWLNEWLHCNQLKLRLVTFLTPHV